jgi:hypothetical protein
MNGIFCSLIVPFFFEVNDEYVERIFECGENDHNFNN